MDTCPDPSREERFTELLAEVWEPLQRFLRRRSADGDDVLADTTLALWRRLDDIPADARLAWSYGVARHCLLNAQRSDVRRTRLLRRVALEPLAPPPEEDPLLAAALSRLSAADQELLRLWAWEELAPRDIAVVLSISANAASIRLHRALGRLRSALSAPSAPSTTGGKGSGSAGHLARRQGQEAPQ